MMSTFTRLKPFDWKVFLEQWSREFIASANNLHQISAEVIESGWLGYPGATEAQIIQAEARLQTKLPPSYRAFLKVSNGWRQLTPFIYRIWAVEDIDWFVVKHQSWLNAFVERQARFQDQPQTGTLNGALVTPHVSDADYFLYGDEQDCSKIRSEYLNTALEISEKGEAAIYLLNPQVKTDAGEWEAWFFGDWLPGADRYPSFQAMMEAEYANFLEMREVL
jgi:SMI1 / KNR4 family (SUKH-1)